jgi:hypothetical protein
VFWLAGTVLQVIGIPGVIAAFPAVKGLRADAKVAAGKAGVTTVGIIVIKPF